MFHRGMVIWIIFTLAAGPGFCCCTVSQIAHRLTSIVRSSQEQGRSSSPHCSCCCQKLSDQSVESDQEKNSQPPPKQSCPCRGQRGNAIVDSDTLTQGLRILQESTFSWCWCWTLSLIKTPKVDSVVANSFALRGWCRFCHLTSQQALSTLQIFLC